MKQYFTLFTSLVVLASCSDKLTEPVVLPAPVDIVLTKSQEEVTARSNTFGFDIMESLSQKVEGDLVMSPLSLSSALAMTAIGAQGETREQMVSVLGMSEFTNDDLAGYFETMYKGLNQVDGSVKFNLANSIWSHYTLLENYTRQVEKPFSAKLAAPVDMKDKDTFSVISEWVADNTFGKGPVIGFIEDLKALFLNTVYFRGDWGIKFDKTENGIFHGLDGNSEVSYMVGETKIPFGQIGTMKYVSLPFGNGAFRLLAAIDDENTTSDVLNLLSKNWESVTRVYSDIKDVKIRLPETKVDSQFKDNLKEVLKEKGMIVPFESDKADFSLIYDTDEPVIIKMEILQDANMEFNIEGCEATATTQIRHLSGSLEGEILQPEVIFDKPFVFAIYERSTKAVLFLGIRR